MVYSPTFKINSNDSSVIHRQIGSLNSSLQLEDRREVKEGNVLVGNREVREGSVGRVMLPVRSNMNTNTNTTITFSHIPS